MEADEHKLPETAELKDNSSENLHVLLNTIEGINQSRELESILEESMEATRLVMSSAASSLMLLDEETGELNISLPTGPAKKEIRGKRIPKSKGIGGWVLENRQPYISNDLESSEIFWGEVAEEFETKNIICVPLINKNNKAIGVLQALNKRRGEEFNPHDIPVFQALASHVTMAIERVREQEELIGKIKNQEKLLAEFQKRIESSLEIISSLVVKDIERLDNAAFKKILQNTNNRIQSLAGVQKFLSKQEMADEVALAVYLRRLGLKICEAFSDTDSIEIEVTGDTIEAEADKALISGLILYELLTRIHQSVHSSNGGGKILIEITSKGSGQIQIRIEDTATEVLRELFSESLKNADIFNADILEENEFSIVPGEHNSSLLIIYFNK